MNSVKKTVQKTTTQKQLRDQKSDLEAIQMNLITVVPKSTCDISSDIVHKRLHHGSFTILRKYDNMILNKIPNLLVSDRTVTMNASGIYDIKIFHQLTWKCQGI